MPTCGILSAVDKKKKTENAQVRCVNRLPRLLTSLFDRKYCSYNDDHLREECTKIFDRGVLRVTESEAKYLEEQTRLQAQSQLWFQHRVGRITASKFGDVCKAKLIKPTASLVKSIMQDNKFDSSKVPALQWGISNECVARESYLQSQGIEHDNLEYRPAGLHIHTSYSYLAASPDGVISCKCCGEGLIEIKCPYKYRDTHPGDVSDSTFYLQRNANGQLRLSREHNYYYQIQGQLSICEKSFCDFICWTRKGIHVERIVHNRSFMDSIKPAVDRFFKDAVLPRILCGPGLNSNKENADALNSHTLDADEESEPLYCWCQEPEWGSMVGCDNKHCKYEWFHYSCVGITRKPRGRWYCSDACKSAAAGI